MVTVADLQAEKGQRKFVQVTANTEAEACAVEEAGIEVIVCDVVNNSIVREANKTAFLTSAIRMTELATTDDIMREAFRCLHLGADAIITPHSFAVVEALATESIPVMGHLGLVPRKSTWFGGLRAFGKTADEAIELYRNYKRMKDAGAFAVASEVIPGQVMAEITRRTSLVAVSLGPAPVPMSRFCSWTISAVKPQTHRVMPVPSAISELFTKRSTMRESTH